MDNGFNNENASRDFNQGEVNPVNYQPEGTSENVSGQTYQGVNQNYNNYTQPSQNQTPNNNVGQNVNASQNQNPNNNVRQDVNGPQNQAYAYSYGPGYVNAEYPNGNYNGAYNNPPKQNKPKKHKQGKKSITVGGVCAMLAVAILLSAGIGFGGAYAVFNLKFKDSGHHGSAVIYESTNPAVDEIGKDGQLSVPQVAAAVADSVVEITTETVSTSLFYGQYVTKGAGSGVIVSADGYIVTNNHVIEGATNVTVITKSGDEYEAKLVGKDKKSDLAVVKISAENLKPAVFGDSDKVVAGQGTVVIGNPLGSLGGSVTSGIVSALDRQITVDKQTMTLMQIDAAVNPGNSGGGAFDMNGNLIGIVNAKSTGEGIDNLGFAIPVNTVKKVMADLIEYGYVTGRLSTGFTPIDLTDPSAAMSYRVDRTGIYVYSVQDEKSSFRRGDLLVSMDGTVISSMSDYNAVVDRHKLGDTIEATVIRKGEQKTLTLTFSEYIPSKEDENPSNIPTEQKNPSIFDFFF